MKDLRPDASAAAAHAVPWKAMRSTLPVMLFSVALLYGASVHFKTAIYPEDDAFITYRYVDNFLQGRGLVYNPGEKVFGVSTPLYLGWLILLKAALPSRSVPELAVRGNFLFYGLAGVAFLLLLRRLTSMPALSALLASFFIVRQDMLRRSTGGMETYLFVALLLFSLWALSTRRFVPAALLAGLSVLARPEGILLVLVVLAAWLLSGRKRPLAVVGGLFSPLLLWVVLGSSYYGSPVYHSITAKSQPLYQLRFGHALLRIYREAEYRVLGNFSPLPPAGLDYLWKPSLLTVTMAILTALALWGYLRRRRLLSFRGLAVEPLLALFGLFLIFYLVTNPLIFEWYYPPLAVLWCLVTTTGIILLVTDLSAGRRRLSLIGLGLLLAFSGVTSTRALLADIAAGRPVTDLALENDAVRLRIGAYREAAEWLNANLPRKAVLMSPEVGSLGYYYQGRIIDACGLVSPEALPFIPVPASEKYTPECGAISLEMVSSLKPELIVAMNTFAGLSLYDSPWFRRAYVLVRQFPLPRKTWNSSTVDVFLRADLRRAGD